MYMKNQEKLCPHISGAHQVLHILPLKTNEIENKMNNPILKVESVKIRELVDAAYNPRKIFPDSLAQLTESIRRFGLVDPIIVNSAKSRKNVVIGGHMRLKAARKLGYDTVPVVYVNIPDIEKEKELNVRLNRNTGEWDIDKLKAFPADFLFDVGFTELDLKNFWQEELEVADEDFDAEKELKNIKEPKTKLGDLILLGKHRLICGNSTDPLVLKRLFGNEKASMIYSDPVYNIKIDYDKGIGGKQSYGGNVNDDRSYEEYREFIRKSIEAALPISSADLHVFYWCDQTYIGLFQELYRQFGIDNKRVCMWIKNGQNPTPGVAFNKCYEPCVYGAKGRPHLTEINDLNEVMNKETTTGNSLLEEISDIWKMKRLFGKEYEHATSKPPKLHEKAIRRCTKPNDIILDSFSGSASTLIAGEQLKRRVFAVELEPRFCDLAIKRYEALTQIKAKIIPAHEEEQDETGVPRSS
ncbi:MAG: DNA modification methylase [Candidatus Taylorbacteria bacterium]|nr:DNA modification methylase [Candidatus Taylorbacteria bacterium]